MPLGIHRLWAGIEASASTPIAASSPLQSAIACTVPMWFFTPRRLGITTSAWLGSITVKRGRMVQKYGATWLKAKEKIRSPTTGIAWALSYRSTTLLMRATLPVGNLVGEAADQPPGVVGRVALHVVVEVDEAVAPVGRPAAQLLLPRRQGGVAVAAGVPLHVPVQAHVDQWPDGLLEARELAGRVGHDQCDAAVLEDGQCLIGLETTVARLQRVVQRPVRHRARPELVAADLVVVPSGELRRLRRGPGQEREELAHDRGVPGEVGRQLPQDRPELRPEGQHPLCEEVGQRHLDVAQPLHVRDEPAALDREHEVLGHLFAPLLPARGSLQRVERAELGGGVLQLASLRQVRGVEVAAPRRVAPP